MKQSLAPLSLLHKALKLNVLIVIGFLLFMSMGAKADALFGVISYHVVPLQIEGIQQTQGGEMLPSTETYNQESTDDDEQDEQSPVRTVSYEKDKPKSKPVKM